MGRRLARLKSSMQRPQFGMTKRRPANSNSSYKISNDRFLNMHVSNKSKISCHKDRCVKYQIGEWVVNQVESDLEGCNYCKNLINTVLHYFVFLLMYFLYLFVLMLYLFTLFVVHFDCETDVGDLTCTKPAARQSWVIAMQLDCSHHSQVQLILFKMLISLAYVYYF